MSNRTTGWTLACFGVAIICVTGGFVYGIPAGIAILGAWMVVFGIGFLIGGDDD